MGRGGGGFVSNLEINLLWLVIASKALRDKCFVVLFLFGFVLLGLTIISTEIL